MQPIQQLVSKGKVLAPAFMGFPYSLPDTGLVMLLLFPVISLTHPIDEIMWQCLLLTLHLLATGAYEGALSHLGASQQLY